MLMKPAMYLDSIMFIEENEQTKHGRNKLKDALSFVERDMQFRGAMPSDMFLNNHQ